MHTLQQLREGTLHGIRRLQLREGLTEFPREIFQLADSLEILDLSGNQLRALPDDLPRLHKLRVIFCSDNPFTELPEVLGQCAHLSMVGFKACRIAHISAKALPARLRWLILTDNALSTLPAEIGQCTQLQKLMLAGNQLRQLPSELAHCTRLELLRISANQLTELPPWLLTMPRLTWLAFAGNPFTHTLEAQALSHAPTPHIAWSRLQLQQRLGEGASGVIHQALLETDGDCGTHHQAVAVKLFKGSVTSDGLPDCEMAACMHAGKHPYLVSAMARVSEHPSKQQALVMPLIDPEFINLAKPPSLASCTRDVYDEHTSIKPATVRRWALGLTSAMRHLHDQGLMHGDFYGHNILCVPDGDARLGDFGAASFFSKDDHALAEGLQRIEVRALGCLLEELLAHCDARESLENLAHVKTIMHQCLSENPSQRPLFAHVESLLQLRELV